MQPVQKTVAVIAASPVPERLLALTDTHALFSPSRGDTGVSVTDPLSPREDREGGLRSEVVRLRRALRTRPASITPMPLPPEFSKTLGMRRVSRAE